MGCIAGFMVTAFACLDSAATVWDLIASGFALHSITQRRLYPARSPSWQASPRSRPQNCLTIYLSHHQDSITNDIVISYTMLSLFIGAVRAPPVRRFDAIRLRPGTRSPFQQGMGLDKRVASWMAWSGGKPVRQAGIRRFQTLVPGPGFRRRLRSSQALT